VSGQPQAGRRIDLNCDLGESSGPDQAALEERLLPQVTSINIACGFHGGHPDVMRRLVRSGRAAGVAIGAHPGFRDPEGLGRRDLPLSPEQIESAVAYQVGALAAVAALEGARLTHVKPHGALYHLAARDSEAAEAVARAVAAVDRRLVLVGLAGSRSVEAGRRLGLATAEEAFADRAYLDDGRLVPRSQPGALLIKEEEVVAQAVSIVRDGILRSSAGGVVRLHADTLCLHGDTPGADRLAAAVRRALEGAGLCVQALG